MRSTGLIHSFVSSVIQFKDASIQGGGDKLCTVYIFSQSVHTHVRTYTHKCTDLHLLPFEDIRGLFLEDYGN